MRNSVKHIVVVCVLVVAVIIAAIVIATRLDIENVSVVQGRVECRTYRASSKIPGRIDSLFVREGDYVLQGDLLYTIATPELDAKLLQVEALRSAAEAMSDEVDMGARKEQIDALRNVWQSAEAGYVLAMKSYERVARLYDKGVVPRQQYDEALANMEAMKGRMEAARAQYELALAGATTYQRNAALAKVREAQGGVKEVDSYLSSARVYAPISGRVSDIAAYAGELVSTGYPVVTILDIDDCWTTFNVRETQMRGVAVGDKFKGWVPALEQTLDFEVYYIAAEADFATWGATRARGGFDIRTFEVRARCTQPAVALLPGMSVVVKGEI